MSRLAFLILFPLLCLPASADDLHDRFDKAVKELRSDDAAERDKGSAELEAIAKEAPELVLPLAKDADPEVRVRARELLRRLYLLADSPEERRAMDILVRLSEVKGKERDDLIDELLSLGEPAGRLLSGELENRALEPEEQPIAVLQVERRMPRRSKVKNVGRTALWVGAAEVSELETDFIGRRRKCFGVGPEVGIDLCIDPHAHAPEFRRWLQAATRIPVGSSADLDKSSAWPVSAYGPRRFISLTEGGRNYSEPVRAEIGGVTVRVSNELFPAYPIARIIVLGEQGSSQFTSKTVRNDGKVGLEIQAVKDCAEVFTYPDLDNFWFVALNKAGDLVSFGPMGPTTPEKKTWAAGDSLTVWLETAIPTGTARIFLGYDWGVEDGKQVVPPPLEIPESEQGADPK